MSQLVVLALPFTRSRRLKDPMNPKDFQAKVAIITGAASGIGQALAMELANQGANLVLIDRQGDAVHEIAKELHQVGIKAMAFEADVRNSQQIAQIVDTVSREYQRIDYLFNNAGIGIGALTESMSLEDWQYILDVNVTGVIHGIHAVYPIMQKQRSGHIINTASIAGLGPTPLSVAYSTSKHAVVGLSLSFRAEAALSHIRVSALCPGVIQTPILKGGKYGRILGFDPEEILEQWQAWLRPMDADRFARSVLKQVKQNRAIIIAPRIWKAAWYLNRLAPNFSVWITQKTVASTLKKSRRGR